MMVNLYLFTNTWKWTERTLRAQAQKNLVDQHSLRLMLSPKLKNFRTVAKGMNFHRKGLYNQAIYSRYFHIQPCETYVQCVHSKTDIYCLNTCIKVVHRLQLMTTHTKQSLHPARSNALGPHFVLVPHRPEAETQVLILCQQQHWHQRSNTAPRTQRLGSWLRVLGLNFSEGLLSQLVVGPFSISM